MLKIFLLALLGSLPLANVIHAQDQTGFISLDCGLPKDSNYTETTTGINYISDDAFVETGIGKSILQEFQTGQQKQMRRVRSFPDGIRNCYRFNLTKGSRYLIRTNFMYGNYDEKNSVPGFDMFIGPNKWLSVTFENNASFVAIGEIIHILPSDYLHICLVNTGLGTPFISALELRPLFENSTYKAQSGSLNLFTRLDVASTTNLTIRYNDDVHDRSWFPYNSANWARINTSLTVDAESHNSYQPPAVVMNTAGTPKNASQSMDFYLETEDPSIQFYVYMHFAEVQILQANQSRQFNISLNGEHWYGPFSPNYLLTTTVFSPTALIGGNYSFSLYKTGNSTLPPIINAIEVYSVKEFLQLQTEQIDVDAITNIKATYGLKKNWQGDPCAPLAYLWDGLNCSYGDSSSPRITYLNLSSSGLKGGITSYVSNLTSLQFLDLSNNNLTGSVPDFLSKLPLRTLNLQGNKLNGSVPVELLERSKNGSLSLSVGGNPGLCSKISCKKRKNNVVVPVVASVAGSVFLLAAALAIFFVLKRKRQVGKVKRESKNKIDSFEAKSRHLSYSDVVKITNNFERTLGKGGFGTVYYGRLNEIDVAVKMLSSSSAQGFQQFQAEVKLLMRVHHRNLTSLVGHCDEDNQTALIYEFMANGNLQEYLSDISKKVLSWQERLRIAVESAQGLEYLHNGCKPPIVHRDVKSTNILLNEKLQAKLADFGLSKSFATDANTHVSTVVAGTPGYLDPEYYTSNRLTEKSDVYSFGVVILEIITCKPAISRINEEEKIHIRQWVNSLIAKGDIKSIVDPRLQEDFDANSVWKAVELAMACLSPTGNQRPTMSQVVMELSECLAAEMARANSGRGFHSKGSIDHLMMSMNLGTELNPRAR
ncbi:LRR receptor-like serine/threonine-protein kinase IOS1 [Citrus sinensis]|nr:LRR receptor-like serine/threonine-protein kinase IOS1 [Citrus sinensis]